MLIFALSIKEKLSINSSIVNIRRMEKVQQHQLNIRIIWKYFGTNI